MAEQGFSQNVHAIGERSIEEAAIRGAATVEAEHVLLALLSDPGFVASRIFADVGLDYDGFTAALRNERIQSLAIAGVTIPEMPPQASAARKAKPKWGASLRDVMDKMRQGPTRDRRRRVLEVEFTVAILRAEIGRIPRTLSFANVDRLALIESVRAL